MKQIFASLLVLALVSGFKDPTKPHGPLLVIDTAGVANFGAVPNKGGGIKRNFTLRNVGDEALHVTRVRPACGCTMASLEDTIIAPGESTTLKVGFQEENHWPAPFKKEIAIFSDSRDNGMFSIWFYGDIVAAPDWDGKRTVTTSNPRVGDHKFTFVPGDSSSRKK